MQWTHEKPTTEGWYWVGSGEGEHFRCFLQHAADYTDEGFMSWEPDRAESLEDFEPVADDAAHIQYYGPLIEPEAP